MAESGGPSPRSRARPPSPPWPSEIQPASPKRPRTATAPSCPICGAATADDAHVNECLDRPFALPPSCPVCGEPGDDAHVEACIDRACPPSPPRSPRPGDSETEPSSRDGVSLEELLGPELARHADALRRGGVACLEDVGKVPVASNAFLQYECGMTTLGPRKKVARRLRQLKQMALEAAVDTREVARSASGEGRVKLDVAALPKSAVAPPLTQPVNIFGAPVRKVWDIFSATFRADPATAVAGGKNPQAKQMGEAPSGSQSVVLRGPRKHALSHRIPGSTFTVDSFKAGRSDPCMRFWLTHFHSDHYGGLTTTSMRPGAMVLCSEITASLVKSNLRVPAERIQVLPTGGKGVDVPDPEDSSNGVRVWCYDANHCPGAVVMLFYVWRTKRYVLHSGDCRFDLDVFSKHEQLVKVIKAGQLDFLHLDTTYCDPRYVFPHQRDVLARVVDAAQRENKRTGGRCIFFFGSYSIGKERVFLAVADALNLHIYADKRKMGILRQVGMPSLQKRLVDRPADARVHVLPMRNLSPDGVRTHATRAGMNRKFIGSGLAIVFRPTGWSFRPSEGGGGDGVRRSVRAADQSITFDVAYSEHSSFVELAEFVKFANPARILPTVNARSKDESDRLCRLLGHKDRPLRKIIN
jgi:DNA cross-link repair 1A protein